MAGPEVIRRDKMMIFLSEEAYPWYNKYLPFFSYDLQKRFGIPF
jgi:hypothetical protein